MKVCRILLTLFCFIFLPLLQADDTSIEYKIRAGYLYNFTKFITWPTDNANTFNLCILGGDPFADLIDPIEQQQALGRQIKLFRFDSFKSLGHDQICHILYVSSFLNGIPTSQELNGTLLVGEGSDFIDQGGMISFVNIQGKIKLHINLKSITQSSLKISAKLLEVAVLVKGVKND